MAEKIKERQRGLRLLSADTVLGIKFKRVEFEGEWRDLIGCPALVGVWIIWAQTSNGKTTAAMKLAKYLTDFEKVMYWSKEEGVSDSLQDAILRAKLDPKQKRKFFFVPQEETFESFKERLRDPKSPKVVFMDSLQVMAKLYGSQFYYELKEEFAHKKLFVFISQAEGQNPKGAIGDDVRYDANVKMRVERFKLTAESRIRNSVNGAHVVVDDKMYNEYWRV